MKEREREKRCSESGAGVERSLVWKFHSFFSLIFFWGTGHQVLV